MNATEHQAERQPAVERPYITTAETARTFGVRAQTVRRAYCIGGNYMGIRPVKLPNRRLLWPMDGIRRVLGEA